MFPGSSAVPNQPSRRWLFHTSRQSWLQPNASPSSATYSHTGSAVSSKSVRPSGTASTTIMHAKRNPTTPTMRQSLRTTGAPPLHHLLGGAISRIRKMAAKQAKIVSAVIACG